MEQHTRLQSIDCDSVKRFSFDGVDTLGRVAHAHDADTVTIIFEWHDQLIKLNARLAGIDAPELNSKVLAESEACRAGTQALRDLIQDKVVRVELANFDKFGRPLAILHTLKPLGDGSMSVNDWLIKQGYARRYMGDKKAAWTNQELTAPIVATKKKRKPRKRVVCS
jgi:endonuclease YncB( thermonuclease family)